MDKKKVDHHTITETKWKQELQLEKKGRRLQNKSYNWIKKGRWLHHYGAKIMPLRTHAGISLYGNLFWGKYRLS